MTGTGTRTHVQCRRCGFGIPADAPLCPGCRRPAIDDWKRRARSVATVERQARRIDPPLREAGYRSLLGAATTARMLLVLAVGAAVVTAAAYAVAVVVDEVTIDAGSTTVEIADLTRWATVALLVVTVATGIAFVRWAVRAYRNLPALGITERRYWTIWLVVGWVIPGANLLVPKLLVDDLWRASSPNLPVDPGDSWQRRPVASLVNRWWCSFLLSPALVVLAVVAARGGIEDFDRRVAIGAVCVAAATAVVVAGTAARRLVAVVTVAQARRADVIVDVRDDERAAMDHRLAMTRALS